MPIGPASAMAMHKWGPKPKSPEQKRRAEKRKGQGWFARLIGGKRSTTPAAQALQPQGYVRPGPVYMQPRGQARIAQRLYDPRAAAQRPYRTYPPDARVQRSYNPAARAQLYERDALARERWAMDAERMRYQSMSMRPISQARGAKKPKTPLSKRLFNAIFTEEGSVLHDPLFDS